MLYNDKLSDRTLDGLVSAQRDAGLSLLLIVGNLNESGTEKATSVVHHPLPPSQGRRSSLDFTDPLEELSKGFTEDLGQGRDVSQDEIVLEGEAVHVALHL